MIITCEECSTRFDLDESILKTEGSKVRCSLCKHIFTAFPQISDTIAASEPQDEIEFDFQEDTAPENFEAENSERDEFESDRFQADESGTEFEETDFEISDLDFELKEEGLDTDEIDLTMETESDSANIEIDFDPESDEFESDELESNELESDGLESDELESVELESDELESDGLESDELEFDGLESDGLESDGLESDGLESDELESDELEFDEEDLTFDDADIEFDNPDLEIENSDEFDSSEYTIDHDSFTLELEDTTETTEETLEADLSFEDDPDVDLVFEETGEEQDLAQALEADFPDDQNMTFPDLNMDTEDQESPEADLELEFDEDPFEVEEASSQTGSEIQVEEALPGPGDDFSAYDQIIDQDTEPEEDLHEIDMASEPEEPQNQLNGMEQDTTLIAPPILDQPGRPRKRKKRSAVGGPVMLLLLLFILVAGAYIASMTLGYKIPFLSDVKIPVIEQYFKKTTPEKSAPKPIPNEGSVNGRFISNDTAGELFIITGRIENPATIPYSHIQVKGTLITKGKVKAKTQTIFCGNIISEEVLKTGNISDISKQLNIREGSHNSNVNVKPGGFVPFMLVFSSLPENLENFTVEVVEF